MRYRAALIGCGKIGSLFADDPRMQGDVFTHAEAYVRCPATELVAVCDADPARAAACAGRWQVPAQFTDVDALLRGARPDLVSVCTPDATHFAVVSQLLAAPHPPRAILCEKPLALSVAQGRQMVAAAAARGVVLAVMFMRRHARNFQALKKLLVAGELGAVQAVHGWYTKGVVHNGSHWFDLLRFLVGEVRAVQAWNRCGDDAADPTLDVLLELHGGALASLQGCDPRLFTVFEMDVMGTAGRVRIRDSGYRIDCERAVDSPRYSGYRELVPRPCELGDRRDVMLHAVEDLVASVATPRAPASGGLDGVAALAIGQAALQAAREGRRVELAAERGAQ